jgi:hypothetical protein
MRRFLSQFNRSQIRSLAGKSVGHVRKNHSAVDSRRVGLQPEVIIRSFQELLDGLHVMAIPPRHVHERIVIHQDAVLVLTGCLLVLLESLKPAAFEIGVVATAVEIGDDARRRRVPLERILGARIRTEAIIPGLCTQ